MKSLILLILFTLSLSVFCSETLKGNFEIENTHYELLYTYDIPFNQSATSQNTRIVDDIRLPEQTETMPAFCMFDMTFPANVDVVIKQISTDKVVYTKSSIEYFSASTFTGLVGADGCKWEVSQWKDKVSALLRVTDLSFSLGEKSYRYFMDTNFMIAINGAPGDQVVAKGTKPIKGSDGHRDGEIWIDTKPTADGKYQRVWAPLSL